MISLVESVLALSTITTFQSSFSDSSLQYASSTTGNVWEPLWVAIKTVIMISGAFENRS